MAQKKDGPLSFRAYVETEDFKRSISEIERRIIGMSSKTEQEGQKIDATFKRMSVGLAGYFTGVELKNLANNVVSIRGEFQQLEIAFTTMLKSKARADELMSKIVDYAAATPFDLKETATGVKQLIAYGSAAETVVDEVRMLGDVAAGVSAPLGDIVYLYGTLRTQGRAYSVDIKQFAGRGIPIYQELAKVLKINVDEVNNFVENGKVGFKEVEQSFRNMTGAGGMFEGLTEKQSKSLTGLISNFQDALDRMFNALGQQNEDLIADTIKGATSIVDNYEDVIKVMKIAVATFGAYKAALIATSILQSRSATTGLLSLINGYLNLSNTLGPLTAKQTLFNKAVNANLYAAAAAALFALISYLVLSKKEMVDMKTSTELLGEATKDLSAQVNKEKSEISSLVSILKNQNIAESVRLESYEKLKKISPSIIGNLSFEASKTSDLTQAVNGYIVALEKRLKLEANSEGLYNAYKQEYSAEAELEKQEKILKEFEDLQKKQQNQANKNEFSPLALAIKNAQERVQNAKNDLNDARLATEDVRAKYESVASKSEKEMLQDRLRNLEQLKTTLDKYSPRYKKVEDEINQIKKSLIEPEKNIEKTFTEKLADANDAGRLRLLKSLQKTDSEYEAYVKKITDVKGQHKQGSKEWNNLAGLLEELKKQQKSLASGDTLTPFGSIEYWKELAKTAWEKVEKINPFKEGADDEIQKYLDQKQVADKYVEDLTKKYTIKSFEETLEDKKKLYEQYTRWTQFLSKEAADKEFGDLIKNGQSFAAFLEKEIKALQLKVQEGTATPAERSNLVVLRASFETETGELDKYKKNLSNAIDLLESYTEKIEYLQSEQSKTSAVDTEKQLFLSEQLYELEKGRTRLLKDYTIENNLQEAKRTEIAKHYNDLRQELDKKYYQNKTEEYQKALDRINNSEAEEYESLTSRLKLLAEHSQRELSIILKVTNEQQIKEFIDKTSGQLNELKTKMAAGKILTSSEVQAYVVLTETLVKAQVSLNDLKLDKYQALLGIFGQIGAELSNIEGGLGDVGRLLSVASSKGGEMLNITRAIAKSTKLTSAAMELQAKSEKMIGAEREIAIKQVHALSEEAAEASKNVQGSVVQISTTIVAEIIKSWVEQAKLNKALKQSYIDIQKEYNALLLEELRLNTLNERSFIKNYKGIANDAVQAALVAQKRLNEIENSLSKTMGAIIKKHAGFLGVGAFNVEAPIAKIYPDLFKTINGVTRLNVELAETIVASGTLTDDAVSMVNEAIKMQKTIDASAGQIQDLIDDLVGDIGVKLQNSLVTAFDTGADAAKAFKDVVSEVVFDIARQLMFSSIWGPASEDLRKRIAKALDSGEFNLSNVFDGWAKDYHHLVEVTKKNDDAFKDTWEKLGYKLPTSKDTNSLTGNIKSITEETASVLAGQLNAIRITQANQHELIRNQLLALNKIAVNSDFLPYLESIDKKVGKLTNANSGDLRAGGM